MERKRRSRFGIGSDIDWGYRTTNEKNACLSSGGSCFWPRGKNLGGTSSHNGMMYTRGHPKDYDDWAAMGNDGWSWQDVSRSRLNRIIEFSSPKVKVK